MVWELIGQELFSVFFSFRNVYKFNPVVSVNNLENGKSLRASSNKGSYVQGELQFDLARQPTLVVISILIYKHY